METIRFNGNGQSQAFTNVQTGLSFYVQLACSRAHGKTVYWLCDGMTDEAQTIPVALDAVMMLVRERTETYRVPRMNAVTVNDLPSFEVNGPQEAAKIESELLDSSLCTEAYMGTSGGKWRIYTDCDGDNFALVVLHVRAEMQRAANLATNFGAY